jgi:hypothetical protein
MKLKTAHAVAAISLALWAVPGYGQSLTLNFSVNTGASLQFNGASDSFQFNAPGTNYQWHITTESGGSSALNLNGAFNFGSGGPFHYGPITTTGSGLTMIQQATVTGPLGTMIINDGTGNLSASVNFRDVETFATSGGGMNANLAVNLSGVTYSGSNPDLLFLKAAQSATLDLSFQFSPGETLTQLSTGTGPYLTSFSGSLTAVPEPSTLVLAALGGLGLVLLNQRRVR